MAREEKKSVEELFSNLPSRMTEFSGTERISTGSVIFDLVLGGGIPVGSSLLVASEPGCGKTSLLLSTAKNYIRLGHKVLYLDYEKGVTTSMLDGFGLMPHVYDPSGKITGTVNNEGMFYILRPSTFSEGETIMDTLVTTGEFGLCVIDSASFMIPDDLVAEKEKDRVSISANRPGWQAQLMSKWMMKYNTYALWYKTSIIYVSQMRTKISFVQTTKESAGGFGLKHGVSAEIMMVRDSYITKKVDTMEGNQELKYGANVRIWCKKSRISSPFLEGVLTILFGKGVSNIYSYKKWLMGKTIEVDGKEKSMLAMAGSGYWTMYLPSGEYKARGESEVYKIIKSNLNEIKQYVDEHGGFKLIITEGIADE